MKRYNVTGCTFIRNTMAGAFCLFESMASLLPYVDAMVIVDLGSDDGTLEQLAEIAYHNSRVTVVNDVFSCVDAKAFADAANTAISLATTDHVLFWQADEIWHPDLLDRMADSFQAGVYDLSFWRYQLRDNFQTMKWFPHPVHRVGPKDNFNFVNDGMNSDRVWGATLCSKYDGGYFTQWGTMPELEIPVTDMILDVSLVGGFRDNIPERRRLHAPMWHEEPKIEGRTITAWMGEELVNPVWTLPTSPFSIPPIMKYHVGKTVYTLREELKSHLMKDSTKEILR